LADAFTIRGFWGMATPGDTMPKALTAARRAVTLDPDLAEGQSALALALLLWERDYAAALSAFERCLALNPNYTQGRSWFGVFYLSLLCNRADDAIVEVRRAVEIDPLSGYTAAVLAIVLFCGGRTAESLDVARRAVERDPDSILTHWAHQIAAQLNGLEEESVAAGLRAEAVSGGHSFPIGYAVVGHVTFGRIQEARAAQARLLDLAARKYVPASIRALVASMMGEQDRAMELVEEACDERDPVLLFMARAFPGFERVRDDPRGRTGSRCVS
jgi:tetratricopeptide (TPR) repeat protein